MSFMDANEQTLPQMHVLRSESGKLFRLLQYLQITKLIWISISLVVLIVYWINRLHNLNDGRSGWFMLTLYQFEFCRWNWGDAWEAVVLQPFNRPRHWSIVSTSGGGSVINVSVTPPVSPPQLPRKLRNYRTKYPALLLAYSLNVFYHKQQCFICTTYCSGDCSFSCSNIFNTVWMYKVHDNKSRKFGIKKLESIVLELRHRF